MKPSWLLVLGLYGCGGSTPGPTGPGGTSPSREQLITDAISALSAGNAEQLMTLSDSTELRKTAVDCADGDEAKILSKRRAALAETLEHARGWKIELLSINSDGNVNHPNATFVGKGGSVGSMCTARVDLMFYNAEVRLRLTRNSESRETSIKLELANVGSRWYLLELPTDLENEGNLALGVMTKFTNQMCDCKDKACADHVNEGLTKWGMEMAKKASRQTDKPDPELAKKAADVMTRYTECMTKMFMLDQPTPEP